MRGERPQARTSSKRMNSAHTSAHRHVDARQCVPGTSHERACTKNAVDNYSYEHRGSPYNIPGEFGLMRHAAMPIRIAVMAHNMQPNSIDPIPHT